MAKITKKAKLIAAKVNAEQKYEVAEAVKLVKEFATAKFDETIEIAFNLNLDPTKAEQQLRGAIVLPHGTGKTSKILVFAEGDAATAATALQARRCRARIGPSQSVANLRCQRARLLHLLVVVYLSELVTRHGNAPPRGGATKDQALARSSS